VFSREASELLHERLQFGGGDAAAVLSGSEIAWSKTNNCICVVTAELGQHSCRAPRQAFLHEVFDSGLGERRRFPLPSRLPGQVVCERLSQIADRTIGAGLSDNRQQHPCFDPSAAGDGPGADRHGSLDHSPPSLKQAWRGFGFSCQ
jgi:hypothetical protein